MTTETERLDYLIKVLAGNNAKSFAEKAQIRPDSLSRARKGINRPSTYFERILAAFPQVQREWLYHGTGEPLLQDKERSEMLKRMASLEKEVRRLAMAVEELVKCQKSASDQ